MTYDLKPEHQQVIDLAIQSGAYQNPHEVLDEAFEIIRAQLQLKNSIADDLAAVASQITTFLSAGQSGITDVQ
jgi:hypothetical protein